MLRLPAVVCALAFIACAPPASPDAPSSDAPAPPDVRGLLPEPPSDDVVGHEWLLAEVDGEPAPVGPRATVVFSPEAGEEGWSGVGGHSGCNQYGTRYRAEADAADGLRVTMGPGWSSTTPRCGGARGALEEALTTRLPLTRRAVRAGDRLALLDSTGAERLGLRLRPEGVVDARAFRRGRWRLDSLAAAPDGRVETAAPERVYEVAFGADGTFTGTSGCHTFRGEYTLDGDRLRVTRYLPENAECPPDDRDWAGATGLEHGRVQASEDRLVIEAPSGNRTVFARP